MSTECSKHYWSAGHFPSLLLRSNPSQVSRGASVQLTGHATNFGNDLILFATWKRFIPHCLAQTYTSQGRASSGTIPGSVLGLSDPVWTANWNSSHYRPSEQSTTTFKAHIASFFAVRWTVRGLYVLMGLIQPVFQIQDLHSRSHQDIQIRRYILLWTYLTHLDINFRLAEVTTACLGYNIQAIQQTLHPFGHKFDCQFGFYQSQAVLRTFCTTELQRFPCKLSISKLIANKRTFDTSTYGPSFPCTHLHWREGSHGPPTH